MSTFKLEPWTALVIVAGIAGVIAMAYLRVDTTALAAYAAAAITLAGALRQLAYTKPVDVPATLTVAPDGSVKVASSQSTEVSK